MGKVFVRIDLVISEGSLTGLNRGPPRQLWRMCEANQAGIVL